MIVNFTDHLGSVRATWSEAGERTATDYKPFGDVVWNLNGTQTRTFIGKESDRESNLGDFGARKYDARIGRFTSVDALWEIQPDQTPYHYSYNSPINYSDPSGLFPMIDNVAYERAMQNIAESNEETVRGVRHNPLKSYGRSPIFSSIGGGSYVIYTPHRWTEPDPLTPERYIPGFYTVIDKKGDPSAVNTSGSPGNINLDGGNGSPQYAAGPGAGVVPQRQGISGTNVISRLMAISQEHFAAIRSESARTGFEVGSFLVTTQTMTWVRWTSWHNDGSPNHLYSLDEVLEIKPDNPEDNVNKDWGERVIAQVHTHPDDNPHSPRDINTFCASLMWSNSAEYSHLTYNMNIVLSPNVTYVLQFTDAAKAKEIYNKIGFDGIEKAWYTARDNSKGTQPEKQIAGVNAVVKLFRGSLRFNIIRR